MSRLAKIQCFSFESRDSLFFHLGVFGAIGSHFFVLSRAAGVSCFIDSGRGSMLRELAARTSGLRSALMRDGVLASTTTRNSSIAQNMYDSRVKEVCLVRRRFYA